MRKLALAVLWMFVLPGDLTSAAEQIDHGTRGDVCLKDTEIAPQQRQALDDVAVAFVQEVLGPDPTKAYAMMTSEARNSLASDVFVAGVGAMVQSAAPFKNTQVAHTYYIQDTGSGPDARTVCGSLTNKDWVSVSLRPGLTQGHVLISSQTNNNDWAFTFWLLPQGSGWQVQYFHMAISSMVGLTPEMLLERARKERDTGHPFNAGMLYAGVRGTIDRGPAFQLGIQHAVEDDLAKFDIPAELSGSPPFEWKMNGATFIVGGTSIIGVAGNLGLVFDLPQSTWTDDKDADANNRAFINAFIAAHPDYSRSFEFLVARAHKPDRSGGFATVYEYGKGFD